MGMGVVLEMGVVLGGAGFLISCCTDDVPPPFLPEYGEGVVSVFSCCQGRRDSLGCQVAKVVRLDLVGGGGCHGYTIFVLSFRCM